MKRAVLGLLAAVVTLPPLLVLPGRWVNPPTSALMLLRRAQGVTPIRYEWVDLQKAPRHVALALLAGEDQRFYEHHGVDTASLRSALWNWRKGRGLRGASTITQQVAKNLFLWPGRSPLRKGLELYFALWLELLWNKTRILEVYANIVELGKGTFGIGAASRTELKKPVPKLTPADAALLAAVLPNPLRMRIAQPSAYVQRRRQEILGDMERLAAYLAARGVQLPGQ